MAGFYEAISEKTKGIVYDLGAGSGILSSFAAPHAEFVYAIEIDNSIAERAQTNLSNVENVEVICADATKFSFSKKADVIICEMLDTALIDEEQIPVLNFVRKYLKNDGIIIPCGIINCIEPVHVETEYICYEEDGHPKNQVLGTLQFYSRINFLDYTNETFKEYLDIKINTSGYVSGVKITTFTLLTDNIISGPTPMLNPPLIIPVERTKVYPGNKLLLELYYEMGGGLGSVKAKIKKIH
ncbi:MAG TPA: methyltransferase domain-containing protein [Methanobacterium sp.]